MTNTIKKIVKSLDSIDDNALYTPKEVIDLPAVKNSKLISSVFQLYRLMKNKKIIVTVDKSTGDLPRYLISGRSIREFITNRYQLN